MDLDRTLARHALVVILNQISLRDEAHAAMAQDALDRAAPETLRKLVHAGAGRPWGGPLMEALAQVGILSAGEILHG